MRKMEAIPASAVKMMSRHLVFIKSFEILEVSWPCEVCTGEPGPVDCVLGTWGRWSECSASCGPSGSQTRSRLISVHASLGGVACNVSDLLQTASCTDVPCPVHCEWANWGEWSRCTKECEGGTRNRHRNETVQSEYGGTQCEGSADEDRPIRKRFFLYMLYHAWQYCIL